MPRWIELGTICQSATVRDALLSILEGGVTTLTVPALPAFPELTVVAQFAFTEPDLGSKEVLTLRVYGPDGEELAAFAIPVIPERPPDADLEIPYVFTWVQRVTVPIERAGLFSIQLSMAEVASKRLPLRVLV